MKNSDYTDCDSATVFIDFFCLFIALVYFFSLLVYLDLFFLYRWGRWTEILEQGQFKRGWREQDVEDCARVIVSYITNIF